MSKRYPLNTKYGVEIEDYGVLVVEHSPTTSFTLMDLSGLILAPGEHYVLLSKDESKALRKALKAVEEVLG